MKIPGRKPTEAALRLELAERQAVIERARNAARQPGGVTRDQFARLIAEAEPAAKRAGEILAELEGRASSLQRAATQQATGGGRPAAATTDAAQQSAWDRMREENQQRRAEQKRLDELAGQEAARKRHAQRVASGRALEPLWTLDPHLQAVALLASGRIWSWSRGVAVPGETVRDGATGEAFSWEQIAERGGRIPQLIDGPEVLVLWSLCHLISERGTDGVVTVNPKQERLWPMGLTDVRGSLKRLHELELIEIREQTGDTLTIGWGALALRELDRFVASFSPPAKRRGRLAQLISPDLSASAEAEAAIAVVQQRLENERAAADEGAKPEPVEPERVPTFASSLPPSTAPDRERARPRRIARERELQTDDDPQATP